MDGAVKLLHVRYPRFASGFAQVCLSVLFVSESYSKTLTNSLRSLRSILHTNAGIRNIYVLKMLTTNPKVVTEKFSPPTQRKNEKNKKQTRIRSQPSLMKNHLDLLFF